jgi:c-di-AMP phosphodiesterase-like protein
MKNKRILNLLGIGVFILILIVILLSVTGLISGQYGDLIITLSGVLIGIFLLYFKKKID